MLPAESALALELTRTALKAISIPDAVQPALQRLLEHTAAVGAAYFQLKDDQMYHARTAAGELPEGEAMQAILMHGLPSNLPLLQALQEATQPLFFPVTAEDPVATGFPQLGVQSLAAAPVRDAQGQLQGAFLMHTFQEHRWTVQEKQLFVAVSAMMSLVTVRFIVEEKLLDTREAALRALGLALEFKDGETRGHTERVTHMAVKLGTLFQLEAQDLEALRWGAYLHDVGKLGTPDHVLLKKGQLTAEEWATMQNHVLEGGRFADALGFLPQSSRQVVLAHHEKWNGTGYPVGLKGEDIPRFARIFAVCDVYDALISERPYKRAWSHQEAMQEIRFQSGKHFDPQVVDALGQLMALTAEDVTTMAPQMHQGLN
ncbi:phosphohydrolase [Deinococcus roseus]|uniref:Phosphohydrolase n=2 Tax=Deinococcus roseus TaxID=392414 RepID=A0ABQ2CX94_9DEIO|nr:phosphohydrolase [Deinococcus roseus]